MPYPSQRWTNEPTPERSSYEDESNSRLERERALGDADLASGVHEDTPPQFRGLTASSGPKEKRYQGSQGRSRRASSLSESDLSNMDVESSREARLAKHGEILREISQNAAELKTEASPQTAGRIKGLVDKFKTLKPGAEKETVRRSVHSLVAGVGGRNDRATSNTYQLPHGQEMPCATAGCQNIIQYDTHPGVKGAKPPAGAVPVHKSETGRTIVSRSGEDLYGSWGKLPSNRGGGDVTCPDGKCNVAGLPNVQRPAER